MFPVSDGEFCDRSEVMLWRPRLNVAGLRWRILWASLWSVPAMWTGLGAAAVVFGILQRWGASVGVGVGVLHTGVRVVCFRDDHRHARGRGCFLERIPGRFFYRPTDFSFLPPVRAATVTAIIGAIQELYNGAAVGWIPAHLLRTAHHLAFEALDALARTQPARAALAHSDSTLADDVSPLQTMVTEIDHAVDQVATCLLDSATLSRAWNTKLKQLAVRHAFDTHTATLAHLRNPLLISTAQDVVEGVFATITAARDITSSGPFDWEVPDRIARTTS